MSKKAVAVLPLRFLDNPWHRLVWITPVSMLLWALLLAGFSSMLRQPKTASETPAVEASLVELPPSDGRPGGAASIAPKASAPKLPQSIRRKVPIVHKRPKTRRRAIPVHDYSVHKLAVPLNPPARSGEKTATESPAPPIPTAPSRPAGDGAGGGAGPTNGSRGAGSASGFGTDSAGARAIYAPVPKIPDELREYAMQAVAVAHFVVNQDGTVQVSLVHSTASPELNQVLLQTLRQWRFFPAQKDGVPVDSQFNVRIPITVE